MTPEMLQRLSRRRPPPPSVPDEVVIRGEEAIATLPEGAKAQLPLAVLLDRVAPARLDTGGIILPDGFKTMRTEGTVTIGVWECPPRLYNFRWIAPDSPAPFGSEATYRNVCIALPYLAIFAVFAPGESGHLQLTHSNECFFRTAPLRQLDDELLFPALLNCSKFDPPEGRPLAWVCSQYVRPPNLPPTADLPARFVAGYESLRHCLLETAFNYSSEHHEGASWYSASREIDPRLQTVEAWEAASVADPLFVLEVPWLKTGHTVRSVIERIFRNLHAPPSRYHRASALARIIFNGQPAKATRPATPSSGPTSKSAADPAPTPTPSTAAPQPPNPASPPPAELSLFDAIERLL